MKNAVGYIVTAVLCLASGIVIGGYVTQFDNENPFISPFVIQEEIKTYPFREYTFSALRNRQYEPRKITIEKELSAEDEEFTSYLFSYSPMGRRMTGQLNIPREVSQDTPVIVMVRGFVPRSIFSTGVGTRNGAAAYARAGFITIAPDFFGYGGSDPEPDDSWLARFEKPIVIIELIKSVQQYGIPIPNSTPHATNNIGLWGHSNGGHISLSVLEILKEPIPTALWAPVTAPFPYSVLFFSDEDEDEGKGLRLSINALEKDYELREFSISYYLDSLLGPIQLHHGDADTEALKAWSDEFMEKIEKENDRRQYLKETYEESATESAKAQDPFLQPIDITYHEYPSADHNLSPNWNTVVTRDIEFYKQHLVTRETLLGKTQLSE